MLPALEGGGLLVGESVGEDVGKGRRGIGEGELRIEVWKDGREEERVNFLFL